MIFLKRRKFGGVEILSQWQVVGSMDEGESNMAQIKNVEKKFCQTRLRKNKMLPQNSLPQKRTDE